VICRNRDGPSDLLTGVIASFFSLAPAAHPANCAGQVAGEQSLVQKGYCLFEIASLTNKVKTGVAKDAPRNDRIKKTILA
jgi:hypothetical protein